MTRAFRLNVFRKPVHRLIAEAGAFALAGQTAELTYAPGGGVPLLEADHYVATDGVGSGPGTFEAPWSLAFAASGAGGALTGGEIVDIRAGEYNVQSFEFTVNGSIGTGVDDIDGKIIFRNYEGERVIIWGDTASTAVDDIQFNGNWLWFIGIEFRGKHWSERVNSHTGGATAYLNQTTDGCKFIHCYVRDGDDNFFIEQGVGRVEIYANLIFNPGNDTNPRGHGLYIHHDDVSGTKDLVIEGNVIFNTFGFGIQNYDGGSAGNCKGIKIRKNVIFNTGVLNTTPHWPAVVFDNSADDLLRSEFVDNLVLFAADAQSDDAMLVGSAGDFSQIDILRNYFVRVGGNGSFGGVYIEGPAFTTPGSLKYKENFVHVAGTGNRYGIRINSFDYSGVDLDDNEYIRDPATTSWRQASTGKTLATWKTDTGLGANDTATATNPSANKYVARKFDKFSALNLCRKWGVVTYVNWEGLSSDIPIDLSAILDVGEPYKIYDVRDAFPDSTPILQGTYGGGTLDFPDSQVADPTVIGGSASSPVATAPFHNTFIVRAA